MSSCKPDRIVPHPITAQQDMRAKGEAVGFQAEECEYVCVYNTNRKTGVQLRRVFVHALFRRPEV